MKTFFAALLAASVAATKYSNATGAVVTGIKSSKLDITAALASDKITHVVAAELVASAKLAAATDKAEQGACSLREATKWVCITGKAIGGASKYTGEVQTYTASTKPVEKTASGLGSQTNLTADVNAVVAVAATDFNTAGTVTLSTSDAEQKAWTSPSFKVATDALTFTLGATYTDPTAGTTARLDVVKKGMADSVFQGVSFVKSGATLVSKFAVLKLTTGALSTVASAGVAIAALSMAF